MGRNRDEIWKHTKMSESGDLLCEYCQMKISGGASRIRSHLSGIKGRGIEVCLKVPAEVQLKACEGVDIPTKRVKTEATSNNVPEGESSSSFSSIRKPTCMEKDKNEMDKRLATFLIIAKFSPSDAIRSTAFLEFLEGIEAYGSNYERPGYHTLESQLMENIKKEAKEYYDNAIINSAEKGCSLMYSKYEIKKDLFAWTPNGLIHVKSCSSSRDRVEIISTAMKEIGAANVVQFIFDDFEYGIRDMLGREYPHIYQTPCVGRAICRLLQKVLAVDFVKRVVEVVDTFNDLIDTSNIKVYGKEVKYKRRKSTACKVYEFISLFKTESEWQGLYGELCKQLSSSAIFFLNLLSFDSGFLSEIKIVATIIRPLFKALFLVYGKGSSSGQLYGAIQEVEDAVKECCEKNHNLQEVQILFKKHRSYIIQPVHAAAAFLNPIYMFRRNLDDDEMKQGISNTCEKLLQVDEKKAFMEQVEQYRLLISSVSLNEATEVHPQTWWELNGKDLHVLQKYAIRILSQPCSSLLSLHYQLHQENHEFGINVALMERFKPPQIQMQEPSILEDLDYIFDEIRSGILDPIFDDIPAGILEDRDPIFNEIPPEIHEDPDAIFENLDSIVKDLHPIVGDPCPIVGNLDPIVVGNLDPIVIGGVDPNVIGGVDPIFNGNLFRMNGDLDEFLSYSSNVEMARWHDMRGE